MLVVERREGVPGTRIGAEIVLDCNIIYLLLWLFVVACYVLCVVAVVCRLSLLVCGLAEMEREREREGGGDGILLLWLKRVDRG